MICDEAIYSDEDLKGYIDKEIIKKEKSEFEEEEEKGPIQVTDPNNNIVWNCDRIMDDLPLIYKDQKEKFNKCLRLLNTFILWDDTLEKQIIKLRFILKDKGFSQEFKKQLDVVYLYANIKDSEYIPINQKFLEQYFTEEKQEGISFLCPEIDKRTGGLLPGTICTIAGGPGSMKTTTALNIAYNALKQGKNICYLSLEETPLQLFCKLLSRVSVDVGTPLKVNDILQHKLTESDEETLKNKILPYFVNLPGSIHIIGEKDLINYEFSEIDRVLKVVEDNIISQSKDNNGIDLLVVDHLQLFKYSSKNKDEKQVMNEYVSYFRKQSLSFLGQERQVAIILLSQVNREGIAYAQKQKNDGSYLMQHVAEASEIERASSYIISVYTSPENQLCKLLKMGAIKLRNATLPFDTINVFADGAYYQVGDSLPPEQMDYSSEDLGLGSDLLDTTTEPTTSYEELMRMLDETT